MPGGGVARGKERRGRKEVKGIMLPCYHNDGIGPPQSMNIDRDTNLLA